MSSPKEYYSNYLADRYLSEFNECLCELIKIQKPNHVFEFGCGTGKNLDYIKNFTRYNLFTEHLNSDENVCGLDISWQNVSHAYVNSIPFVILGDETHLRHLCNFDIVFTCSVLDHIEDISGIIDEFKRIANKCIFLAETNDAIGEYYFPHDYESYGFEKLDYEWHSQLPKGDGARYNIWKWVKE